MSDYKINFGNIIGPNDTDKLYDMLDIVNQGDELIITVDANEPDQVHFISNVLDGNNFDISKKASEKDGRFNIIAHRRR